MTIFLTSTGVDLVRKDAVQGVRVNPFDPPLDELIERFKTKGGTIWVCPLCAKVRGYTEEDLIEGAVIRGSTAMHELILEGASTLSF